jgi:hypothetical protein
MERKDLLLVLKFPNARMDITDAISSYKSVPPPPRGMSSELHP